MRQVEESRLRGDGSKVVTKQGRQSLARVSALDGRHTSSESNALVMMDDYVVQAEPVVDHLTRFSGITPGECVSTLVFCGFLCHEEMNEKTTSDMKHQQNQR